MNVIEWLSLVAVCLLGEMSPGPSLAVVMGNTLRGGSIAGYIASIAHGIGVALYGLLTVTGLAVLLTRSPSLYLALQVAGALYLLWLGAWFTTNMLFSRLRQAAEHAVTPDLYDPDPRLHTRTTIARWWERLTLAPNGVNFHLEHHLLPSVPPYRLPSLHRMLQERGFYEQAEIANGYREVVAKLTVKQPAEEPAEAAG